MGASAISRSGRKFKLRGDSWDTTIGPIVDVTGMTSGAIYVDGANLTPNWFSVNGIRRDNVFGYDPSRMYGVDGAELTPPVLADKRWTMIPYEFFFFSFWQLQATAPADGQFYLFHLKG